MKRKNDNTFSDVSRALSDSSKRNLLRVTGGVGVSALVTQWQKPVIQSVVLPAHGATTICTIPPVPGRSVVCEDTEFFINIDYVFALDENGCPVWSETQFNDTPPERAENVYRIVWRRHATDQLTIVAVSELGARAIDQFCDSPNEDLTDPRELGVIVDGVTINLSLVLSRNASSVSISETIATVAP